MGQILEHRERRGRDGALVDVPGVRPGAQKRGVQRRSLRAGQPPHRVLADSIQQIRQRGVGESRLRAARDARQDASATKAGRVDPGPYERRLPDPRLSLEDEHCEPVGEQIEEPFDRLQLTGAAFDPGQHGATVSHR